MRLVELDRISEGWFKAHLVSLRGRSRTEAAPAAPNTEPEALRAEAAQLRRCLAAGHLHSTAGWSAGSYLMKVEAKPRTPREHY